MTTPTQSSSVCSFPLRDVKLTDWQKCIAGQWSYRQLASDPLWRHGWISLDAITWNPEDQAIYCGLNSIDGDLLYRFEPKAEQFQWALLTNSNS